MALQFPALKTMVTIFALVLANASPVEPVAALAGIGLSEVASIAAQVITAGTSLTNTFQKLAASEASVTCAVQVENWTRYPLLYPTVRVNGNGHLITAQTAVLPGKKEAIALEKPSGTLTGVSGTASWVLGDTNRRLVIMYSVPYSYIFHSNWMGVGITRTGVTQVPSGNEWFDQMYYHGDTRDLSFKRGEFYRVTNPVIYSDDKFEIVGTMTNVHKAQIKVVVRPSKSNWGDLALPIRAMLEKKEAQRKRRTTN